MKQLFCLFLLSLLLGQSFGQINIKTVHPLFQGDLNGDSIRKHYDITGNQVVPENVGTSNGNSQLPAVYLQFFHSNNLFPASVFNAHTRNISSTVDETVSRSGIAAEEFSTMAENISGQVNVYDSLGVIVLASGINPENSKFYEYRAIKNDSAEVISWTPISLFSDTYTQRTYFNGIDEKKVAYLGEFRENYGNKLTIQVRKKNTNEITTQFSAFWARLSPSVIATFSDKDMPDFLKVYRYQWKNDFMRGGTHYSDLDNEPVDSLLRKQTEFAPSENNIIFYLSGKIKNKELLEYRLLRDRDQSEWQTNDHNTNLIWLHDLKPGSYVLQMRYSVQKQNISEYKFTIDPAWHQTLAFKIIGGMLFMILFSFGIIMYVLSVQRAKTKKENLQKRLVEAEIKSIRSQFNPHFVFNSISSIQGLITANDMEGANKYLTSFSTLMRESLNASARENSSLTTEVKMLNSYLKLEQLRFGFRFNITVDNDINGDSVEIPSLLLQPLVENAVKHGLSSLYENGQLLINFKKSGNGLLTTINDNGAGFDTLKQTDGFGLRMTKDRIQLLNTTYKDQSITMDLQPQKNQDGRGTSIHVHFNNWFI